MFNAEHPRRPIVYSGDTGSGIQMRRRTVGWMAVAGVLACAGARAGEVELRRTTDGIPHVRADTWRDLGRGIGHVQAEDTLCTLAEAFVTFEGSRSRHFGADARPRHDATFGRPKNIDLDFFFRAFADDTVVAQYRAAQPPELRDLVAGFAAGYNGYLREARAAAAPSPHPTCLRKPWVREITSDDLFRRMFAANVAGGYGRFVTELANSRPGRTPKARAPAATDVAALRQRLAVRVGEQPGLGSNMFAFGGRATNGDGGVLLGNPHWYWGGPDRFYQMHLTLPGRLDVAGVSFLGVPVVMIGFNAQVAWSHTVSEARRFGLFDLALDPADPTRHLVDGVSVPMEARRVTVPLRGRTVSRTFYRSRFGPVIDLGGQHPAFGWGRQHAVAIRDVNAENFRIFRNFFAWNQAASLDEFIAIQRREAAVPWVNTAAIARGDGRAWYADIGAVPNVPDTLRAGCTTPLGRAFAALDAATPFLDGSRAACDWVTDPEAVQPGAMPARSMPGLLREDYVANMNGSYWLGNVHAPMTGFPAVMGGEREPLSLRSRLGHRMAIDLAEAGSPSSRLLSERLMHDALAPRAHSAELFKPALLETVCAAPAGETAAACRVLRAWPDRADAVDRGTLLWDAFWTRLDDLPDGVPYRVPFAADAPLDTPRDPDGADPAVRRALLAAARDLRRRGWPLDAAPRGRLYARSGGEHVSLYGGCHAVGYFVIACNRDGSRVIEPWSHANSYLQVVRFGPDGPEAHTLLSHGERDTAVDGGAGSAPVKRYAQKAWLRFPFDEASIVADPQLTRRTLPP